MNLTDRYVSATVAHLPRDQREDVAAELAASIADAIDARREAVQATTEDDTAAEREVLESLGDPERLAATYVSRPLALIGPDLYLAWKRLLTTLMWVVVPVIAVLAGIGAAADGKGVGGIVLALWVGAITTAVHVGFWVTLVFARLDRAPKDTLVTGPWTVDKLDGVPDTRITGGETIATAVVIVLTAAVIMWQHVWPWTTSTSGEGLPVIDPALWSFTLPALLVLLVIELVAVMARHARGRWAPHDWRVSVAVNAATVAILVPPLVTHTFLNRELFAEVGWPDADSPISLAQLEIYMAIGVVIGALTDVIPAWRKARSTR